MKCFIIYQIRYGDVLDKQINEAAAAFCNGSYKDHDRLTFTYELCMLGNDTRFMPMLYTFAEKLHRAKSKR